MFATIRFVQLEVHVLEDMLVMSMLSFEAEFTNHRAYLALRHRAFHTGEMYLLHSVGGRQNNCHDSLHTGASAKHHNPYFDLIALFCSLKSK